MRNLSRVGIILVGYALLAFAFSQVIPFNKGPDEGINLNYIEFITANGRLPITYEERAQVGPKGNWPALYHLILAEISNVVNIDTQGPPHIKIFWDSFRYRAIDIEADSTWYLLTEDQDWPYYGRILVLHIGRWLSILFSVITLVLVYLITLEVRPDQPWLAPIATAILAFIPTFIFIGSVLNEDALVAALAAIYFLMLVRVIKQPEKLWPYWVMGIALGLSVTVKYTTIVLPLEVLLVIIIVARQKGYIWHWWLQRVLIVGASAILASSWWFGWNFWHLNEIEESGLVAGILRPLLTGGTDVTMARLGNIFTSGQIGLSNLPENTTIGTFPGWVQSTFLSFWGVGIAGKSPWFPYTYLAIGLMLITSTRGLWQLWRMDKGKNPHPIQQTSGRIQNRQWLALLTFHIAIFFVAPLVRFGLSRRLGQTAQGRHILIPAAAAIIILLVWGIATAVPRRWQRLVFAAIIVGFIGWTGAHIYRLATVASPFLPLRTLPEASDWLSSPATAQFGEHIELGSYAVKPQPKQGYIQIDLAWRSLIHTNESYLLRVELINGSGEVVSHWIGYNGQGRLPTLAWDPGDVIFDRLSLPLPDAQAGEYTVQVQVLSNTDPLAITMPGHIGEEEQRSIIKDGNILTLMNISLSEPSTLPLTRRVVVSGASVPTEIPFDLWQTGGPVTTIQNPIYRYPATISILTSPGDFTVELIDPAGRAWPATHSEANIHTFVIGPDWPSGNYGLQVRLMAGDNIIAQATDAKVVTIENWWVRQFEMPEIEIPMEANFASQLKFLGYTLPQKQVRSGESFPITLYWQALPDTSPQADFTQFNHLHDSTGTLRGGYDRRPLEYYSTMLWAPGEVVVDGYAVPVDGDAPPGTYYLDVGYYLTVGESAVNLPLVVDGQMVERTSVTIGPIEVVAP